MKTDKFYFSLVLVLVLLQFFGLFGEVFEPDAALYASISKTIVLKNDWVSLYVNNADWLDKPHLPFWMGALSFKLFGISAFAYKLPSFLISLVGYLYVYLLARSLFNQRVALIAVIISLTALHQVISNYDVRAEGYLTAFIIAAIYHFYRAHHHSFFHIIAGAFFAALAVMTKGIFILIPAVGGFVIYWLWTKQFSQFTKWKWYFAIVLILLFSIPELYTLYVQFDLHPEKIVFGQRNVSGLKFFFWDSRFGRFFNNGPIKGRGEPSFFIHTTLWAFLPWAILFVASLFQLGKRKYRQLQDDKIIILWGSAALTFLIFSMSRFQLPHYIIIIFPQFAIITAKCIDTLTESQEKTFGRIHAILAILVVAMLCGVCYTAQVKNDTFFYIISIGIVLVLAVTSYYNKGALMANSVLTSVAILLFLYGFLYPGILEYQSGMKAARWMNKNYPTLKPASFDYNAFAFDFYTKDSVTHVNGNTLATLPEKNRYGFYVQENMLANLSKSYRVAVLAKFEYFRITKLKPKFLNVKTRKQVLDHFYLVKIE